MTDKSRFRWVYLQLEQLFPCRSDQDIRSRLGKLPPDLESSYAEIYHNNTKNLGDVDRAHVDSAFRWIMCAGPRKDNMDQDWLPRAVCLTATGTVDGKITVKTLLHLCQYLLILSPRTYDHYSGRWGASWIFPHASVAEYFEKKHWTMAEAHGHVAKVCLSQLFTLYGQFDPASLPEENYSASSEPRKEHLEVIDYMRCCWLIHIQAQEHEKPETLDPDMIRLLKKFLGRPMDSSIQYQRWVLHLERAKFRTWELTRSIIIEDLTPSKVALFSMIQFSITTPLMDWWEQAEIDVSVQTDRRRESPLALSTSVKVSELLIKRGANVNEPNRSGSLLVGAIALSNMEMVEFLVKAGAKVNVALDVGNSDGKLRSALWEAVATNKIEIVKFLIEKAGANVNMGHPNQNVLATARDLNILKYLVNIPGAVVHQPDETFGSVFGKAVYTGILDIVRFFIDELEADANEQLDRGRYGSPLSLVGNVSVAKYLVDEAGAKVNAPLQHGDFGSALAAQAWQARLDIVKFLVEEANADVDMPLKYGKYRTALEAAKASLPISLDVVKYLERGPNGKYGVSKEVIIDDVPKEGHDSSGDGEIKGLQHRFTF
jgi:hypothetical protein